MIKTNVYMNFNGNCEEAFTHYKNVFGKEISFIYRYKDVPSEQAIPEHLAEKLMHISIQLSEETMLMGADVAPEFGQTANFGNNISIYVDAENKDEADRIFAGLSDNGTITMPIQNTFWGAYFGACIDKFGVNWMVSTQIESSN